MPKGLLLRASDHTVEEVEVPPPPIDVNALQPAAYSHLLPGADKDHLLLASVPLSERTGNRWLLIYNAGSNGPPNAIATRLTTSLDQDRLEVQIRGDAVAFCASGADLERGDWQQLDNAIYDELVEPGVDVQRVVADLKEGRYDYSKRHEGEEGEDVNKDDAGQDMQDALRDQ